VSPSKGRYRGTMRKEREGHHAAGRETTKTTMIIRCWRDLLHRSRVSPSREPPAAYSLRPRERCGISLASPEQRDLFRENPEGERRRESSRRRIPLNKKKKKKNLSTQAGGLDERTISRDEWAARLRAARVAPAALNAIVMDFLVTEVRKTKRGFSVRRRIRFSRSPPSRLAPRGRPLTGSTSLVPLSPLSTSPPPEKKNRATSRPPRPSPRSREPGPAPTSPRQRAGMRCGPP